MLAKQCAPPPSGSRPPCDETSIRKTPGSSWLKTDSQILELSVKECYPSIDSLWLRKATVD